MSCWEFSPSVWSSSFKSETNMKMQVKHLLFYYYYYYFLNCFSVAFFFHFQYSAACRDAVVCAQLFFKVNK